MTTIGKKYFVMLAYSERIYCGTLSLKVNIPLHSIPLFSEVASKFTRFSPMAAGHSVSVQPNFTNYNVSFLLAATKVVIITEIPADNPTKLSVPMKRT